MSDTQITAAPAGPSKSLACPIPPRTSDEPDSLVAFREHPDDDDAFAHLYKALSEAEEWHFAAILLVLRASVHPDPVKVHELCVLAYKLWLNKVRDRRRAAHALARAVLARPDHAPTYDRLAALYRSLQSHQDIADLLTWRIEQATETDPASLPSLHLELAKHFEHEQDAVSLAVRHYRRALDLDPSLIDIREHLIALHTRAGALSVAAGLLEDELSRLGPDADADRTARLHTRLAQLKWQTTHDAPTAARHLQAAIKAKPDSLEAMCAFGNLYLGSGRTSAGGTQKAAAVFLKAAQIAQTADDLTEALRLARRAFGLDPSLEETAQLYEALLIHKEAWGELDDLYAELLSSLTGAEASDLLMKRAQLLEHQLLRLDKARACYEEASQHQGPDGPAWKALDTLYQANGDWVMLASLLEQQHERLGEATPIDTLLRAATIYREKLDNEERAAVFYYKVLEREPFNAAAFEGYKEHWRRKHHWGYLRDVILYQIDQATEYRGADNPLNTPAFAEEFVELADICERRLGDVDGALAAWQRLEAAYPKDTRPRAQIARIQKRTRMWDNMLKVQETELNRVTDPERRLDIVKRLVQIYRDRYVDPTRAIELYTEILKLRPDDVQAARALTALYDRAGDHAQVYAMLRAQYDRSRSNTERISLLRRMAELAHYELAQPEDAIWACQQILELSAKDIHALHRLQALQFEQARYDELVDSLQQEARSSSKTDDRVLLLRRAAQIAERELGDLGRAAELWADLYSMDPGNIEIIDKMLALYDTSGRPEDVRSTLERAIASPQTPTQRRLGYLQRLGVLAETTLNDSAVARAAYEQALEIRPDHRTITESLAHRYRADEAWDKLAETLGRLQELVETEDERIKLALERAEVFELHLDDASAASDVMLELIASVPASPELNERAYELLRQTDRSREIASQAEMMLLSVEHIAERRALYDSICGAWQALGNKRAALAAYRRSLSEFTPDGEALDRLIELEMDVEDWTNALEAARRRLELSATPSERIVSHEKLAEICERGLGDPARALEELGHALALDPGDNELLERIESFAKRHQMWEALLPLYERRYAHFLEAGSIPEQVDVALQTSVVAEDRMAKPEVAFEWARRAYFVLLEIGDEAIEARERLEELASAHDLWRSMLTVVESEVAMLSARGAVEEVASRLLWCADTCEQELDAPQDAAEYLHRAYELRPHDNDLADRIEALANQHALWDALVRLHEAKLSRLDPGRPRFEAYEKLAQILERRVGEPERAFAALRKGWNELVEAEPDAADEALRPLLALAERTGVWSLLASHYVTVAEQSRGDEGAARAALLEAARVFEQRLDDPLAAARVLYEGFATIDDVEALLPRLRELGAPLDQRFAHVGEPVGALVELAALERALELDDGESSQVEYLSARGQLRESRLDDGAGALAEWARVLEIDPHHEAARQAAQRLADAHDLWLPYLAVVGRDLERADSSDAEITALWAIADLYEEKLARPEYALRARIDAWRRRPSIPPRGALPPEHERLWHLADVMGRYESPALPHDPRLEPVIEEPELADAERWDRAGIDPQTLATRNKVAVGSESETIEVIEDIEEIEELEEVEELDDVDDVSIADGTHAAPPPPPPRPKRTVRVTRLPRLSGPLVSARPRVASAWEELAAAYLDMPTANKAEKADTYLALARLWEEGASDVGRAFQQLRAALGLQPEWETAMELLYELAERHQAHDRLLAVLEDLLYDAALPEHVVPLSLRIARLHESAGDFAKAEKRYLGALSADPDNVEPLAALTKIYEDQQRYEDFVEYDARLLKLQRDTLEPYALIDRTLELAEVYEKRVDRPDEAIDLLQHLARRYPTHREVHEPLIRLLLDQEQWTAAIESMRVASEAVGAQDLTIEHLVRIAEVYEKHLELPERAIEAWLSYRDLVAADDDCLASLQRLYQATGQHEPLLAIVDERLELLGGSHEKRAELLLLKAGVLDEGLKDGSAAIESLEQLVEQLPDNDEIALTLSRLHRQSDRFTDGVRVLEQRLAELRPDEQQRRVRLTTALARAVADEGSDTRRAMAITEEALRRHPMNADLLRLRAEFARTRRDYPVLLETLAGLGDTVSLLEAGDIARLRLADPSRAARLYQRVLEHVRDAGSPGESPHFIPAVEGLVRIQIDAGDLDGALDFMDRQLSGDLSPSVKAKFLTDMGRITKRTIGDLDAARARFEAALQEDPEYAPAKLGLGDILMENGQLDHAEELLDNAVENLGFHRNDPGLLVEGLVLLSRILEQTDRAGEAYRRLTTALRHDPNNIGIRSAIVHNRKAAKRWRDAITAADQLEQRLATGELTLSEDDARLASRIFAMAAECETEIRQPEQTLARYKRALDLDPNNQVALRAIIPCYTERGDLAEAANATAALARQLDDRGEQARAFLDAGILYHQAAQTVTEVQARGDEDVEAKLRKLAFKSIRAAVDRSETEDALALDREQLEVAFDVCLGRDDVLALQCLDGLLKQDDLSVERRVALLLDGAQACLERGDEELEGLERALGYAEEATKLAPGSSAAVLALASVHERLGRTDELETVVREFFSSLDRGDGDAGPDDVSSRIALLRRLSELEGGDPTQAIAALERAHEIDPRGLELSDRIRLDELYRRAYVEGDRVLANHRAILQLDPTHKPSLTALAEAYTEKGELDQAHALYSVLSLLDPLDARATEFLETHYFDGEPEAGELDLASLVGIIPADAGIPDALAQLWEHGSTILGEVLPRADFNPTTRVSPVGEDLLAQSWADLLRAMGQTRVALIDDPERPYLTNHDPVASYFQVSCQQPPVIFTGPKGRASGDAAALRFALARAMYFTHPSVVLATGLDRDMFARILSAALQAFHPRHARRKHYSRGDQDEVLRLSQEFARKLPIRSSRKISGLFSQFENEAFDSLRWRTGIRRAGNRAAVALAGDIRTALEVIADGDIGELHGVAQDNADLRDLLVYVVSPEYTAARRQLGVHVAAR